MSANLDFYLSQAEKCRVEAEASALTQVRDRNMRAAAAWQAMADKLARAETARAERTATATAPANDVAEKLPEN
ncbi:MULTISPECIES: hypothetical protein [unclassified Sphingopyxis]|uniref:hypothetical protein n=1 Tax=unclassified Sphingopyxis TaxID=2614943 RepID=UPI000786440E|nr:MULTISPECIES: hypothetical protein [unclassified Sphingopyxis]USI75539.1 hypothetical protein KEC45_12185 [Sphingopyxis sp. USTB-05]